MRYNCCSYIRTVKDIRSYQEEQTGIKICTFMAFSGGWNINNLLNVISKALGIYNEINMLFFLGFVFIILVIFSLTMSLSRNSERVRKMVQEIALNSYANDKKESGEITKEV